jgi:hypothetical protein
MCNHKASCERSIFFWFKEIVDRVAIEPIQAVKRWDAWVVSHKNTVKGLQLCLMEFRRVEQLSGGRKFWMARRETGDWLGVIGVRKGGRGSSVERTGNERGRARFVLLIV